VGGELSCREGGGLFHSIGANCERGNEGNRTGVYKRGKKKGKWAKNAS